ncbi:MAG: hypothetical protein Q7S60_03620 [bacterium]|nr:hypothetical protein [bacterium]
MSKALLKNFLLVLMFAFLTFLFFSSFSTQPVYAAYDTSDACEIDCKTPCVAEGPLYICEDPPTNPLERSGFGTVELPQALQQRFGTEPGALITLLNIILKLLVTAGGIYALINIIIAGYGFISAGGDPKAITNAWAKIWQSLLGLTIIAGSFLLAAVIGQLIFGKPEAILNPQIYVPK